MNKASLRKFYLQARKDLSETFQKDQAILQSVSAIDFLAIKRLHIFLSIPGKNEVNTLPIISWVRENYPQIEIAVPRVKELEGCFENVILETNSFLMPNKWMVPEPVLGKNLPSQVFDLVFVPLLIADTNGNRVGYGKGYYDRFLSECKPTALKIGLSYFEPIGKIEDIEIHDVKLDALITPNGLIRF